MAYVEYDNGYYQGDLDSGELQHGRGKYVWNDGTYYDGEWYHGNFHGYGKKTYDDGTYYDGEWKDDNKHGYAKVTYDNGYYQGYFANGKKHGKGKYVWNDGTYYDGDWENDESNGFGKEVYDWGYYEGYWKEGDWCGKGTIKYNNGVSVEGVWQDGLNATDITITENGVKRHGKIVNDNFIENPLNGFAKVTYDNGCYEGNFVNGKRHGKGKYVWNDGTYCDGEWYHGNFHGYGKKTYDNGYYQGYFANGKRHGKGKYVWNDGTYYDGEWYHGNFHGYGKKTYDNGYYEGYWKNGDWCGKGKFVWNDGAYYDGEWKDNTNATDVIFVQNDASHRGKIVNNTFEPFPEERNIVGTPGTVTGGSSTDLGKNMLEDMNVPKSTSWGSSGYQAHHIIPKSLGTHPVIRKIGMDMDDASNGIFLRKPNDGINVKSVHLGKHEEYIKAVESFLDKLNVNDDIPTLERKVYALQKALKLALEEGFPIYKKKEGATRGDISYANKGGGATQEMWEELIKRYL